jgi:hypothetical protein
MRNLVIAVAASVMLAGTPAIAKDSGKTSTKSATSSYDACYKACIATGGGGGGKNSAQDGCARKCSK